MMVILIVVAIVATFAIGYAFGKMNRNKQAGMVSQEVELHNTKAEFERYKAEVTEHLSETSALMHAAESNYQQLSEQLTRTKLLLTDLKEIEPAPHGAVPKLSSGELPPRDYAGSSHGLLKQKEKV